VVGWDERVDAVIPDLSCAFAWPTVEPQLDADGRGGGGRVEDQLPAVAADEPVMQVLGCGEFGDEVRKPLGVGVFGGFDGAGPVAVAGAEELVVREVPRDGSAAVAGCAAGAGGLR
jgi:hypothetical protein